MAKRPIDSFVQYFLDVKPYHTKILEIVEQYKFSENINISIQELIEFQESWENDPLCKGVGYGLDFDDESGFDSTSNCDLFECVGGYGLIFDNSDILLTTPVVSIDNSLDTIEVSGDYRYDIYHQIAATSGTDTIRVLGNVVASMSPHQLFLVIPKNKYSIAETTNTGFYIYGNVRDQFLLKREFVVHASPRNDDLYSVVSATYYPADDSTPARTFIETNRTDLNATELGYILIDSGTRNNAVYMRTAVSFDGTYTNIVLHPDTQLALSDEIKHGVIVLRNALVAPRRIWLETDDENTDLVGEWKIVDSSYDPDADTTTIFTEGDPTVPEDVDNFNLKLIGYFFGAGYDGFNECGPPKPNNVHVGFSEYLSIEIIE